MHIIDYISVFFSRKWSSELEDVKIKIQEGVNQEIKKFFEDIDAKVVSVGFFLCRLPHHLLLSDKKCF